MLHECYLKTKQNSLPPTVCLLDSQSWNQSWRPVARHPPPLLFLGSRQRLTFLTEAAPIAWEAKAGEGVDLIDAGTSILTGTGDTVVDVWRGEGGAESEVSLPTGNPWFPGPTGNQAEDGVMILPSILDLSASILVCTNGSSPLEVKRVEPRIT